MGPGPPGPSLPTAAAVGTGGVTGGRTTATRPSRRGRNRRRPRRRRRGAAATRSRRRQRGAGFPEYSHYSEIISTPTQLPGASHAAVQHAIGRSGVSVLTLLLPGDVAGQESPQGSATMAPVDHTPTVRPADTDIDELVRIVDQARRVTLFYDRCARRSYGLLRAGARARGPRAARQGLDPVRQPVQRGYVRVARLGAAYEAMQNSSMATCKFVEYR